MLATVVGWDLYLSTRSALVLGNVGLVQIIPVLLFTFVAGHVADRYNRGDRPGARRVCTGSRGKRARGRADLCLFVSHRYVACVPMAGDLRHASADGAP